MSVNKACSTYLNKLGKNVETRVDTAGECLQMGKGMKVTARWLSASF